MKLYDSIAELKFSSENAECNKACGMYARDGEYVDFVEYCECVGPVRQLTYIVIVAFYFTRIIVYFNLDLLNFDDNLRIFRLKNGLIM